MRPLWLIPATLLALAFGPATAQPPTGGSPVTPPVTPPVTAKVGPKLDAEPKVPAVLEFDVGFLDGSNVKVVVLEPAVAVTTKYGKLTVPLADLRRVEVGFRYPDGVEAKLTTAIERLAAPAYLDREEAAKEIRELKQYAGPALKRAATDDDAERRTRAVALLQVVRREVPAERVDAKDFDTVETADFTVRGRLDAASVKVRTRQFGEAVVKLAEVRQFRAVAAAGPSGEIALDAATHSKLNWSAWLDTEVEVAANAPLEVTATGTIDQWPQEPGRYVSGPAGNGNAAPNQQGNIRVVMPNQSFQNRGMPQGQGMVLSGALIGRVGPAGQPFVVGAAFTQPRMTESGRLFLQIAPSHWGNDNATGVYRVKVKSGG